jgi:hypothetical protein
MVPPSATSTSDASCRAQLGTCCCRAQASAGQVQQDACHAWPPPGGARQRLPECNMYVGSGSWGSTYGIRAGLIVVVRGILADASQNEL